ncbi:penicillin acylase family protein [Halopseudomonas phragmitis]|uniref:Acyl-homoserine-lactone acylase n=1 Tax=Halopseudomonas phragmitis TaxID=1931241 RepID=A0A1V0B5G5_9GAMM|nr:penicillin acylase family protein [Halopseudomonas phragmitis]AQZ95157.1 acyl-homoserine-lactone acylase [Halopseudomonas phragmitis]
MHKKLAGTLVAGTVILSGCLSSGGSSSSSPAPSPSADVTITYTTHGVPHVKANDYFGLGYGVAHAQAEHNLCTLAEQVVTLQGEKAKFFGPGTNNANLLSDVAYKAIDFESMAEERFSLLSGDAQALINGYAEGYNNALAERHSPQDYPTPCRGAEWVQPITANTLLATYLDMATLASTRNFLQAMAAAQPPGGITQLKNNSEQQSQLAKADDQPKPLASAFDLTAQLDPELVLKNEGIGSNGWALGTDRVRDANSLLLGNPHFPWDGASRFYEIHLNIPGELQAHGANMTGIPIVTLGFNQHLGWTHTVSQAKRFTLYQLQLDPSNAQRYFYDGELRDITYKDVIVEVKLPDDSLAPFTRRVFFSHYGPMIDLSSVNPALGWSTTTAITYRDANLGNHRMLDQWLAMNKATSTAELETALAEIQGLPWVNTIMIDKDGNASYIDASVTPLLSAQAEGFWRNAIANDPAAQALWQDGAGQILLPGHLSQFEWVNHPEAVAPGIVPYSLAPKVTRRDYAYNANSSHWLSHVEEPLEGYSIAFGPEQVVRSPRTRYNAQLISDPHAFGLTLADQVFDIEALKLALDHNGSLFGGSFRQQLVQRCQANPQVEVDGQLESLATPCNVLANWDGLYNLDSRGAAMMREFLQEFRVSAHRDLHNNLFAVPFDPDSPADTPRDLAPLAADPLTDPVLQALHKAAKRLSDNNVALDVALGDVQYVLKSSDPNHRFPIHGGQSFEGIFNMISKNARSLAQTGTILTGQDIAGSASLDLLDEGNGPVAAYRINYGTSFALALSYDEQGPKAQVYVTYGQAHDPESEFFADQTELFSNKQWRSMPLTDSEIDAATLRVVELTLP